MVVFISMMNRKKTTKIQLLSLYPFMKDLYSTHLTYWPCSMVVLCKDPSGVTDFKADFNGYRRNGNNARIRTLKSGKIFPLLVYPKTNSSL